MLHQAQRTGQPNACHAQRRGLPSLQGLPAPAMRSAQACQVCRACQRLPSLSGPAKAGRAIPNILGIQEYSLFL